MTGKCTLSCTSPHSKSYSHPLETGPVLPLQDGTTVPSDLFPSQKGTPLLVHPILHYNIRFPHLDTASWSPHFSHRYSRREGSPRDSATLGDVGSCLSCHPIFATKLVSVLFLLHNYMRGMGTLFPFSMLNKQLINSVSPKWVAHQRLGNSIILMIAEQRYSESPFKLFSVV